MSAVLVLVHFRESLPSDSASTVAPACLRRDGAHALRRARAGAAAVIPRAAVPPGLPRGASEQNPSNMVTQHGHYMTLFETPFGPYKTRSTLENSLA